MIPRFIHKLYARAFGFFWLPCPICGKHFGGHQLRTMNHTLWYGDGTGKVTCPDCPIEYQPLPGVGYVIKFERWTDGIRAHLKEIA